MIIIHVINKLNSGNKDISIKLLDFDEIDHSALSILRILGQ